VISLRAIANRGQKFRVLAGQARLVGFASGDEALQGLLTGG
jgi:hypothetical protein